MIEVKAVARKWGNSIGLVLPRDAVEKANIRPGKTVSFFLQEKKVDLTKVFGTLKIDKPTQQILDEIREGEE